MTFKRPPRLSLQSASPPEWAVAGPAGSALDFGRGAIDFFRYQGMAVMGLGMVSGRKYCNRL